MDMLEKIPKCNSVDGQIIMSDFYENHFGIFPHFSQKVKRPMASVALHPAEEIIDGSLLEEAIQTYTKRRIRETYNLSITEFLDLPVHVVNMLLKVADEIGSQNHQVAADVEKELNKNKI